MKCSSCLKVHYCNVECQRNHWARHRSSCHETTGKTIQLVERMKMFLKIKEEIPGMAATYYSGNIPAVDLINLSMNEGEEYFSPLALLLCGVGDPRNVLMTTASLPDACKQQVTFVLNDICPCTLARTVLLLYVLLKGISSTHKIVLTCFFSNFRCTTEFSGVSVTTIV